MEGCAFAQAIGANILAAYTPFLANFVVRRSAGSKKKRKVRFRFEFAIRTENKIVGHWFSVLSEFRMNFNEADDVQETRGPEVDVDEIRRKSN